MNASSEGFVTALVLALVVLPGVAVLWAAAYSGEFDPAVLLDPGMILMLLVGFAGIAAGYRSTSGE
ncbi:hypothetical protein HAPAU_09230 [Halalkalicoccus paucihalophilus]|uniref:Uncharacterized protein n=1 Tax=Halalkalicoccus paucihalophilus TaxID=1008153 RepID=A0A151AHE3_9EURY|nr:hypothetical protein [Halalkalicoccus paucihalophilus]KYH27033.1 hypothetical protein HAPAU_09230 [Halalkalicoccus paucihalophilus]